MGFRHQMRLHLLRCTETWYHQVPIGPTDIDVVCLCNGGFVVPGANTRPHLFCARSCLGSCRSRNDKTRGQPGSLNFSSNKTRRHSCTWLQIGSGLLHSSCTLRQIGFRTGAGATERARAREIIKATAWKRKRDGMEQD